MLANAQEAVMRSASVHLEQIDVYLASGDDPVVKSVARISTLSGMQRRYVFLGLLFSFVGVVLFGHGMPLFCSLVGFLYPCYMSFKALESRTKDDDTQWLTYWVVFGLLSVMEHFSGFLLYWVPFYFILKLVFVIWCMWPGAQNGSMFIYGHAIRPFFLKHEARIDGARAAAARAVADAVTGEGSKEHDF